MKKNFSLLVLLFFYAAVHAQNFPGYRSGNYTGVNGVFFNPANIADSRYRWDFNLVSFNATVGNDKGNFKLKDITTNKTDNFRDRFLGGSGNTNAAVNVEVFGPSAMFNLNSKSSMAVTTRARVVGNVRDIDGNLVQSVINSNANSYPYSFSSNANSTITTNGWGEIGLSYAREISQNGPHYFKGGLTVKYLSGVGNNYVQLGSLNTTIDQDALSQAYLRNTSGTIRVGNAGAVLDKFSFDDLFTKGQNGIGADIGFVYEFRPSYAVAGLDDYQQELNKYKVKFSVSVLDIGKIKYSTNPNTSGGYRVNIAGNTLADRFYLNQLQDKNTDEIKAVLDRNPQFFTASEPNNSISYKANLPTVLQAAFDYHLHRGFFVNLGGQLDMNKAGNLYNAYEYNSITLTPRYEGKIFGVYFPINYNELTHFNAGISLRAGPLFIGSGSIITAISKSKQADVHAGLRFGIMKKNKKDVAAVNIEPIVVRLDRDGDGVLDADDKCPDTPGIAALQGCPDRDGDGIADNEDSCPDVAGTAKYKGCPIPDTDGDGINDEEDKCPSVKGLARYQGCPIPDTDGDGVNDEEDKCPTRPGTAANQGCPEIAKEVIEKINFAAKNVFFATGSYKLLAKSNKSLDAVADLMKKDPTLNLDIDGHTDSQGSDESNQVLSDNRAGAVKNYLISKGIDASRLKSTGYGETKPVADNTTAAGRAKNRRTEMTVRNY
jgi:outer membrane protein OmpA-like peptidoglycan-associated protein